MSKRPFKPFGIGAEKNKLPKLEVTISEHNFPLSQNFQQRSSPRDAAPAEAWGDDNDDDLLLQASQACEQQNISAIPDYSAWIQNPSTSTQIHTFTTNQPDISQIHADQHRLNTDDLNYGQQKNNYPTSSQSNLGASTSKVNLSLKKIEEQNHNFQFKKPTAKPVGKVDNTSGMMDKCNGIALPISGICENVKGSERDEMLVLDNMKGESEHFYRRLLQVQEENARLKSENSKLLEQALSKDGEVTILRGRLKSSQAAVDSARMERLRAGERTQVEWADKVAAANKEVSSLKAQLDFKDLEVVRAKEKCRQLETGKVKLSQMAPTQLNSTHASQRHTVNNNFSIYNDMNATFLAPHHKHKMVCASAQTDTASYTVKLNVTYRSSTPNLSRIVPLLLEPELEQQSVFQDVGSDCSAQRADSEHGVAKRRKKLDLNRVCEEVSCLATVQEWRCLDEAAIKRCRSILSQVKSLLTDVLSELESASRRVTSAHKRELDSKYAQQVHQYTPVEAEQLYGGRSIFKEEQAITARRGVAVLAALCPLCLQLRTSVCVGDDEVISLMSRVTSHVAAISCAVQYSGLLLSFIFLIQSVILHTRKDSEMERLTSIVKDMVLARPSLPVIFAVLPLLRILALRECGLKDFCTDSQSGNLKLDSDQGLVSFSKESCFVQALLSQLETCVKCSERRGRAERVVCVARGLITLYRSADALNAPWCQVNVECRCKCSKRLAQVVTYSLQVCAGIVNYSIVNKTGDNRLHEELLAVCRCGLAILYLWTLKEPEFRTLLGHYEGRYLAFLDLCNEMKQYLIIDEVQGHALSELLTSIQPNLEELDTPSTPVRQLWLDKFNRFHIND